MTQKYAGDRRPETLCRQLITHIIVCEADIVLVFFTDLVKCEGAYKDRYCDQQCTGNAVCSCGEGFALQNQTGKYGDYGACVPGK